MTPKATEAEASEKETKSGGVESPGLRGRQAEFFEEYFQKGAEFARALVAENGELRAQLDEAVAAEKVASSTTSSSSGISLSEIEREHYDLACLFVAQGQLARARDAIEALGVIAEILLNFVGADRFAIYAVYAADGKRVLRPLFSADIDLADLPLEPPKALVRTFEKGVTYCVPIAKAVSGESEPLVCLPLRCGDEVYGAIAVWGFLSQKESIVSIDHRLFDVISDAGGAALESARLRGQTPRISGPIDHYSGLALLLGLGGRGG